MRVVMFDGAAVKRQKKTADNKIEIRFYTRPPRIVSPEEWKAGKQNKYFTAGTQRCEVTRHT